MTTKTGRVLEGVVGEYLKTAQRVADDLEGAENPASRRAYTVIVTSAGLVEALHEGNKALGRRVDAAKTRSLGFVSLGMAVMAGLYGRGRCDLIEKLGVDILFARWVGELVLSAMSPDEVDRATAAKSFRGVLDRVCNASPPPPASESSS